MTCNVIQKPKFSSLRRLNFVGRAISFLTVYCLFLTAAMTVGAQEKQAENQNFNSAVNATESFLPLSLTLNGTNSLLTVPDSTSLNLTGALTLESWIKSADYSTSQTIIERFSNTLRQGGYGLRVSGNAAIFTICPSRGRCMQAASAATLQPNEWQHVAAVFERGEMRIYLNGRRSGSGRNIRGVLPPGSVSEVLKIGSSFDGTQMFHGLLDEVRISNTGLYNFNFSPQTQLVTGTNTAGLWRFDGGSFNDSSTNYNHATVTGDAGFSPDVPDALADGFRITPTPNVGSVNSLTSVKAIFSNDVWAVGYHGPVDFCCYPRTPVSLHWDGSQWNSVPVPTPAGIPGDAVLVAVDASGSTNVWAVGTAGANFSQRVYLLRLNGSNWEIVAVASDPNYPNNGIGTVESITVISENDVWVVGQRVGNNSWTLHWDGTSFQTVPSPNLDSSNQLKDIDAISANDIWAVGNYMVIRWNGSEWLPVPSAPRSAQYKRVAAISPNDVWTIAGYTICPEIGGCMSSVGFLHFNGTQWIPVQPPATNGQLFLEDISATSSDNVWAVGSDGTNKTYVAHYNGSVWQRVASENTSPSDSDLDRLLSVSALNSNEVWTVGFASDLFRHPQGNVNIYNNLALRYSVTP